MFPIYICYMDVKAPLWSPGEEVLDLLDDAGPGHNEESDRGGDCNVCCNGGPSSRIFSGMGAILACSSMFEKMVDLWTSLLISTSLESSAVLVLSMGIEG